MPLSGKVAEIINNRTLALNIGSEAGVREGMTFRIYDGDGKKIIDPETKEELGTAKLEKVDVEVYQVEEKYSLAETFKYTEINEGGVNTAFGSISNVLTPPRYVKRYETFDVTEETKRDIEEAKSIVKVGDIAEELEEESLKKAEPEGIN
jgi:hypothetical protein